VNHDSKLIIGKFHFILLHNIFFLDNHLIYHLIPHFNLQFNLQFNLKLILHKYYFMSYKDFPPGRNRMLAYSKEITNRHISREFNSTSSQWITSQDIIFGTSTNISNSLNNLQMSYEVLSELPTVKVGLISKDLLHKSKIDSSNGLDFCTICQQNIFIDIVRTLDCSHSYHVNCIDRWFTENKKCPQCRFEI
jgi:hypothetical protein